MLKNKSRLVGIIFIFLIFPVFVYAQNVDEILDKYKIKNYWFHIKMGKEFLPMCRKSTFYIDQVGRGLVKSSVYFVYRGDEANKSQHSFQITCPVIAQGYFFYNLYVHGNTKIIIDTCDKKYTDLVKTPLKEDGFGLNKKVCMYHSPNLVIDKKNLQIRTIKEKKQEKVLPNKLLFDNYFKPIILSVLLFFLVLSFLIRREKLS